MGTVLSADGTAIGFEAWGDGPPLVMIDGATAYRAMSQTAAPTCSRPPSGGSRRPSRPPGVDWTHFYAIKWTS